MSDPNIIKPLVLTNSGHFKQMMVIILVLLAIIAASYRILIYTSFSLLLFFIWGHFCSFDILLTVFVCPKQEYSSLQNR